jgi:hypothetical protein
MQLARPAFAPDPRMFGRGRSFDLGDAPISAPAWAVSDNLKLFASTFVVGFLFVSVLIG